MFGRGTSGKLTELANEVRLVGVPTRRGGDRAASPRVRRFEHAQRSLKPGDPRQPLGPHSDIVEKQPFQVTPRHRKLVGETVDRDRALTLDDRLRRESQARIGDPPPDPSLQHDLEERHGCVNIIRLLADALKRACETRRHIVNANRQSRELMLRHAKNRRCPVGVKPDAENSDEAGGLQRELFGDLAGEERGRLRRDVAARAHPFERVAEVHDELRPSIGQNRLRPLVQVVRAAGQRPDAIDDVNQRRGRWELAVIHGSRNATPRVAFVQADAYLPAIEFRAMRTSLIVATLCVLSALPAARQRPDFSGTWTLAPDAPAGPSGKPAPAPGYGPTINIRQDANAITISKIMGGATVHVTHPLDGSESRSRTPGRLCEGDSESVWTAAWQGDAVLTTFLGTRLAGALATTTSGVKALFRLQSPDTMVIETTLPAAGTREARTITTTYKKSGPPAEVPAAAAPPAVKATIGQLDWLAGNWIGTTPTTTFEERWIPAAGGSMIAVSRTIRGGAMTGFEFLCIVERSGGLVYQAMPSGRQPATDFALTKMEAKSLTFENPAHDFPKAIQYTLGEDGTLEAIVSGAEGTKPLRFRWKKQ